MHILIPFAAPAGEQCQRALGQLQLPHLTALLQQLTPTVQRTGQPGDLSPLHERVLAQHAGFADVDGLLPWAARDAAQLLGASATSAAWAWITPCHLQVNADHVAMTDPAQLALSDAESHALLQAMQPYFLEDGITLHWLTASTWLAQGEVFRGLPTASLDRVCGSAVDAWMPRQAPAKVLRRLQNEMQMLLYTHPVNDARSTQRHTTVTSFWVSGTGELPANATSTPPTNAAQAEPITVLHSLQTSARADDAHAWMAAWQALDSTAMAPLQLTLCGEHAAQTFALQPRSLWGRLRQRWTARPATEWLKTL